MKEWRFKEYDGQEKSLIKRLLVTRGIKTDDEIKEFLNPLEMKLTHPRVFTDMEKCVERLAHAIDNGEKIVIHGDFDADGVTSTSLLYKTFKYLGADVNYFIPHREKEGHGFDTKALVKLMTQVKPKLIISCDCGISYLLPDEISQQSSKSKGKYRKSEKSRKNFKGEIFASPQKSGNNAERFQRRAGWRVLRGK